METVLSRTYKAAADYSTAATYQYRWVYLTADDTVTLCESGDPIGILQNNPEQYMPAEVMIMGISKLSMSATCSVQAKIGPTTGGQGVEVTADDGEYGAICLEACTVADQQVDVLLTPGQSLSAGT